MKIMKQMAKNVKQHEKGIRIQWYAICSKESQFLDQELAFQDWKKI